MKKMIMLLMVLMLSMVFCGCSTQQPRNTPSSPAAPAVSATPSVASTESYPAFVAEYFTLIQGHDFDKAMGMFHFPTNYSAEELEKDKSIVKKSLQLLDEKFGKFDSPSLEKKPEVFIQVGVGGGTPEYWKKHPEINRFVFRTTYEKAGPGYMVVNICNVTGMDQIRSVEFGIPKSNPDAEKTVSQIYKDLVKVQQ
jgi:hypothetical protein